jgi:hypothetical protein
LYLIPYFLRIVGGIKHLSLLSLGKMLVIHHAEALMVSNMIKDQRAIQSSTAGQTAAATSGAAAATAVS